MRQCLKQCGRIAIGEAMASLSLELPVIEHSLLAWEQAKPLLRLQLVPAETARFVRGGAYRPACEGLMLAVVLDFGDYATHVTPAMCTLWGRSVDEVFAHARAKLEASERALEVHTAGPLTIYEGDDYVAVALFSALGTLASGGAFVAFPSRDLAIIASADSGADGLAALAQAARDLSHGGLTANVYSWTGDAAALHPYAGPTL